MVTGFTDVTTDFFHNPAPMARIQEQPFGVFPEGENICVA